MTIHVIANPNVTIIVICVFVFLGIFMVISMEFVRRLTNKVLDKVVGAGYS